jgi:hypothetical protein
VEIKAAMRANFTFFNGLMLFAQFQGNCFFPRGNLTARGKMLRDAWHVKSDQCQSENENIERAVKFRQQFPPEETN